MEIATFKVPASNELEVINTSTLIKGLTGSKVISVKIEFQGDGSDYWWYVIVLYESVDTPLPLAPQEKEKQNLKKALEKWVGDATISGNMKKVKVVAKNMDYLIRFHKNILEDIEGLKSLEFVGPKTFDQYGQELYDIIKQAVTEGNANEPDTKED